MKKNPGLRAKRDQHKAHGKLVHVATHQSDEVDSESDEDGGKAVRIYNSILSQQPRAFMMWVEKEACSTLENQYAKKQVLKMEGEEHEFELITEEEMDIIEGMPDEPSPNILDLELSNLAYLATDPLISILPAPQITDLGASNLGD